MFPNQEITTSTATLETTIASSGKTLSFDFDAGDFVVKDGKIVTLTGLEALKMWIKKILRTEKNKYKIYNTDKIEKYGVNLFELTNKGYPFSYVKTQIQTTIIETLLKNIDITGVTDFTFTRDKLKLTVNFTVNSVYGATSEEVTI